MGPDINLLFPVCLLSAHYSALGSHQVGKLSEDTMFAIKVLLVSVVIIVISIGYSLFVVWISGGL